jgi:hypothetical protein
LSEAIRQGTYNSVSSFSGPDVPLILLALALLAAIVYGAVRLYEFVALHFGSGAAVVTILACVMIVVWLVVNALRRYRAVHGVRVGGERIIVISGTWGALRLDADRRMGSLSVDAHETHFVFSDVESAHPVQDAGRWALVLLLAHNRQRKWSIPMPDRGTARRWTKIFRLASSHRL